MRQKNTNAWKYIYSAAFFGAVMIAASSIIASASALESCAEAAQAECYESQDSAAAEDQAFFLQPPLLADVHVRYQNSFVFEGTVTSTRASSLFDTQGVEHPLAISPNVLTELADADALSDNFNISKLDYYDSFGSFYLNCIQIQNTTSTSACGNWNYVVDGKYPSVGMDLYPIKGGEQIYVYYGNPWSITASTSTFPVGATTTLSTLRYNFGDISTEWLADGNDIIDISVPNLSPVGWWDTTLTVATSTSDEAGNLDYVFLSTGTYYAKIISQDYSKWSNSIILQVIDAPLVATSIVSSTLSGANAESGTGADSGNAGFGGGGANAAIIPQSIIEQKVQSILNFLRSREDAEGKIQDGSVTDWAIMSFAAHGEYAEDIKNGGKSLLDFVRNDTGINAEPNVCAAYSRRILALRAAGLAIDSTSVATLISYLTAHCAAEGDQNLPGINDDIFVILALVSSGADARGALIEGLKSALFNAQDTQSGAFYAFGSASPDMTGAAINALQYIKSAGGSIDEQRIAKARIYLKASQLEDGGWNGWGVSSDITTTAWAMEGIAALKEGQNEWANALGKSPWSALVGQLIDKGYYVSPYDAEGIDWFGAKHAVPALLGASWPILLAPKPQAVKTAEVGGGGPSGSNAQAHGSGDATTSDIFFSNSQTTSTIHSVTSITKQIQPHAVADFTTSTPASDEAAVGAILDISSAPNTLTSTTPITPATLPRKRMYINQAIAASDATPAQISAQSSAVFALRGAPNPNPIAPIKKKVAQGAAAGSAIVFGGTSLFLLLRLLLAVL